MDNNQVDELDEILKLENISSHKASETDLSNMINTFNFDSQKKDTLIL